MIVLHKLFDRHRIVLQDKRKIIDTETASIPKERGRCYISSGGETILLIMVKPH